MQTSLSKARAYCRTSADHLEFLESQKKTIHDCCNWKGIQLTKVYEDADINKHELQDLLNETIQGELVIVSDLSRLSRNKEEAVKLLQSFDEKWVFFVCIESNIDFSTPTGRCMFHMLMSFHELKSQTRELNSY